MNETKKEPTTADAFATVREIVEEMSEVTEDRPAWKVLRKELALLERRMGAMERAARLVLETKGANTREAIDAWTALRAALTGAPPVFTLEEVKGATAKPNWYRDAPNRSYEYKDGYEAALSDVLGRLLDLRR